jgi:hypothetical protein
MLTKEERQKMVAERKAARVEGRETTEKAKSGLAAIRTKAAVVAGQIETVVSDLENLFIETEEPKVQRELSLWQNTLEKIENSIDRLDPGQRRRESVAAEIERLEKRAAALKAKMSAPDAE